MGFIEYSESEIDKLSEEAWKSADLKDDGQSKFAFFKGFVLGMNVKHKEIQENTGLGTGE